MSDFTTQQLKERAADRAAVRSKIREAYQRIYNNPYRQSAIIDPAMFRYEAARAYAKEFYKFTPRSLVGLYFHFLIKYLIFFFENIIFKAIPVAVFASVVYIQVLINRERAEKERQIRTGEKTYFERAKWASKFLY